MLGKCVAGGWMLDLGLRNCTFSRGKVALYEYEEMVLAQSIVLTSSKVSATLNVSRWTPDLAGIAKRRGWFLLWRQVTCSTATHWV